MLSFTPAGVVEGGRVGPGATAPLETYQNSFRRGDNRLYLLGRKELRMVGLQTWNQRVEAYVDAGDWLEALALALDQYETEVRGWARG